MKVIVCSSLFFKFVGFLCEFVRVSRIWLSINAIGFFLKIGLNLGDFSHERLEFQTFLCSMLYIICINVLNRRHYVLISRIQDIFVHAASGGLLFDG